MEPNETSAGRQEELVNQIDGALAEIQSTLELMLPLAQLSASGLDLDRDALQRTLERLRRKIDRIADGLDPFT